MLQCFPLDRFQIFSRLSLSLICFLVANLTLAAPCDEVRARFFHRFETLQNSTQDNFGDKVLNSENFPVWSTPSKNSNGEIVYLLHGFLGSPFEMKSTAEVLTQNGYTVIRDILPGHGVTATTANSFSIQNIQQHVFGNLNALKICGQKIHLVGFSTGATLLHHYLQKNSDDYIASVTLISPYYRPSVWFGDLLSLGAGLFISTLSIDFAYTTTRFPDIKVAYLDPIHYVRDIPIQMANEIDSLGDTTLLTAARIAVPVLLLTSTNDQTASPAITHAKVAVDFISPQLMHYGPWYLAPHHIMAEAVSPVAKNAHQLVKTFVSQH